MDKKLLLTSLLSFTISIFSWAQCLTNVDFNTWQQAGILANGNWVVQGGGAQVRQTINGNPTFYVTPFELINVRIQGQFRSTDDDDDFMGFVFGFNDPIGQTTNYNGWLFDWKRGAQNGAPPGMSLSRMNGNIAPADNNTYFWQHNNGPSFTLLNSNYGNGWNRNQNYQFELIYTYTNVQIFVDGQLIFDEPGCYVPGRFGFYNYSQEDCYYSNFQYEMFIDFVVETPTVCPGDVAQFTFLENCFGINFNLNQYQQVYWDFGDGNDLTINDPNSNNVNPTHNYTTPGTYDVTLTVTDNQNCSASATHQIVVNPEPVVDFTYTDTCNGDVTQFTDATNDFGQGIAAYTWDFGGGFSSNQANPTFQFGGTGQYPVTLDVVTSDGCTGSATQNLTIAPLPAADFSTTNVCEGTAAQFTDETTVSSGNITDWSWDFGDNNTSTQQNPTNNYAAANNYTVQLDVTTDAGCTDTYSEQVTVYPAPTADFNFTDECQDDPVNFTGNSQVASGSIAGWDWDFGDGNTDNIEDPTHTYTSDGPFDVTLEVTTDNGCTDQTTQQITIHPLPQAGFTADDVCLGETMDFTDQSGVSSGNITAWDWDLDEGNQSQNQNPSVTYNTVGQKDITLTVTTDNGCTDTYTGQVQVHDVPTADFQFSDVCDGEPVNFTNTSNIGVGNITGYLWDFDEGGNTSAQQDPAPYTYGSDGTYDVQLTVTSGGGCTDDITQTVTIFPVPTADFSNTTECFGSTTQFTDLSAGNGGTINSWDWEFGDNSTGNTQNPTHDYNSHGNYDVTLEVTTADGCTDQISQPVTVHPMPVPEFSNTTVCQNEPTVFTDETVMPAGNIASWSWDFGDNNSANQQNPAHTYNTADIYDVELTVTSDNNCTASITHQVEVYPLPQVDFSADRTEGCRPFEVQFSDNSTIAQGYFLDSYSWDFGDNNFSGTTNPDHLYTMDGIYSVTLTVTSANGCVTTVTEDDMITVWPKPIAKFDYGPQPTDLYQPTITFNNQSIGSTIWDWDFGDGFSSVLENPEHEYLDSGLYTVELISINEFGCSDTVEHVVDIDPIFSFYVPSAFTPNSDGLNDEFSGNGYGVVDYDLRVFTRWGEQVFLSQSMDKPWNGRMHGTGEMVKQDVYVYKVTVKDVFGEEHVYRGHVTLYR